MEIINIRSKSVYVTIEMPVEEISMILDFLDNAKVSYDSKEDTKLEQSVRFVKEVFFENLSTIESEITKE